MKNMVIFLLSTLITYLSTNISHTGIQARVVCPRITRRPMEPIMDEQRTAEPAWILEQLVHLHIHVHAQV